MEINTENRREGRENVPDFREEMNGKSVCGAACGWRDPADRKHTDTRGCTACSGSSGSSEGIYGAADMGMLPAGELSEERDFRMLQGMYPNEAKELLELIEEECDRMEYEGSPMFDEYPDYTTIYTLQKRITDSARRKSEAVSENLIRVLLLQEMHRRRSRYRTCRGVNAL